MIRVVVELLPKGREECRRTLATMEITNTGEGSRTRGFYRVCRIGKTGQRGARGEVSNHPREAASVWDLVEKAIAATRKRRGRG